MSDEFRDASGARLCAWCGKGPVPPSRGTKPRIYCKAGCKQAAYEARKLEQRLEQERAAAAQQAADAVRAEVESGREMQRLLAEARQAGRAEAAAEWARRSGLLRPAPVPPAPGKSGDRPGKSGDRREESNLTLPESQVTPWVTRPNAAAPVRPPAGFRPASPMVVRPAAPMPERAVPAPPAPDAQAAHDRAAAERAARALFPVDALRRAAEGIRHPKRRRPQPDPEA